MSYGITFSVNLSHKEKNKTALLEDMRLNCEMIQSYKEELLMLGAASPHLVEDENDEKWGWEEHVQKKINFILEEFSERFCENVLMQAALDDFDNIKNY